MRVRISPSPSPIPRDLGGPAAIPGSKSHTQRAMLLAAFLPGERRIHNALRSQDTEVLAAALERLGARLRWTDKSLFVHGREGFAPDADVDLGENATALRALLAIVPLLGGRLAVRGAKGLAARPLEPSLALLRSAGVLVSAPALPCTVDARHAKWPARLEIDASLTTQVASGALLGVALRAYWGSDPITVVIQQASASEYVDLTLAMLTEAGFEVQQSKRQGAREVRIALGSRSTLRGFKVPTDASSLCFPRALAAMHDLPVPPWLQRDRGDPHPDHGIALDIAAVQRTPAGGTVLLDGMGARPDAVPALCAFAATRPITTRICGVGALRFKESDRIAALVRGLRAAGAKAREEGDGLVIEGPLGVGGERKGKVRRVGGAGDHRIVMAMGLLGTVIGEGIEVGGGEVVGKSWPGYWGWLGGVAVVEREEGRG